MWRNSEWKELRPPVYPEGDYAAVFCNKCGTKNRQDDGWRYRDDPIHRMTTQQGMYMVQPALMMMMMGSLGNPRGMGGLGGMGLALLLDECGYCRDDDKKIKDYEDDQSEDDEELTVLPSPKPVKKAATEPNTKAAAPKKAASKKVGTTKAAYIKAAPKKVAPKKAAPKKAAPKKAAPKKAAPKKAAPKKAASRKAAPKKAVEMKHKANTSRVTRSTASVVKIEKK